jgi:hypothetical protein
MFFGGAAALAGLRASAANNNDQQRDEQAFQIRQSAALDERKLPDPDHPTNGDEQLYPNRIANYSKGLPHDSRGEVDRAAYDALVRALGTSSTADFENLTMGSADATRQRKFVNPLSGLAFDLEGADCNHLAVAPPPAFASAQQAGEAVELYWMALLRDVSFSDYATNATAQAAATELSHLSDFRGPKSGGQVTTSTLFRGVTPGDLNGPFISQFLWRPVPYGAQSIDSRQRTLAPGLDYLTTFADWLDSQRGIQPLTVNQFDSVRRYVRNARDLGQWVHMDVLFQAYFNAALILLTPPDPTDPITGGGIGAPKNAGNPYNHLRTMQGFGTFGDPAVAAIVAEVATRALKAVWHQKWFVHRRARPEVFGGRVHNRLQNNIDYPIHGTFSTRPPSRGPLANLEATSCHRPSSKDRRCIPPMARDTRLWRAHASPRSKRCSTSPSSFRIPWSRARMAQAWFRTRGRRSPWAAS